VLLTYFLYGEQSKPLNLETLERDITTLQIERESLKNESDTYSADRLKQVEDLISEKKEEQQRLVSIWEQEKARVKDIKDVKRQLDEATNQLEIAQREGNYELASRLHYSEIPALKSKLPAETAGEEVENADMMIRDRLTASDIARVIARSTGIPVENLRQGETEKLLHVSRVKG
jgi:ATP-dependent Clp protease ATP-binding subunit ClpB